MLVLWGNGNRPHRSMIFFLVVADDVMMVKRDHVLSRNQCGATFFTHELEMHGVQFASSLLDVLAPFVIKTLFLKT